MGVVDGPPWCNAAMWVVFVCVVLDVATSSPPENRLMRDLMHGYVPEERPVIDSSQPVVVKLGVTLQQIVDLNEREEQLEVNMWLKYTWRDENLRWDPAQYENVTDLRHPVGSIWTPDVLLYNSVDTAFDSTYKVNLLGYSDGSINWIPPGIFKVSCKLDITFFPFDDQVCVFKFGSWSFSGRQIDLQPADFDFSEYMENGEWAVVRYWVNRSEKFYACCPEPYPDVKFYIHLRRRTLYYAFNLVMPCGLTMVLVMLGFTLSPETCEKVGLQISVSLAICIFLTIVSEMTPRTSEAVPLLGIFFQSCFIVSVGATAFTVYVQSVHFKNQKTQKRMGFWMRYLLLEWIPYLLCIQKPKRKNNWSTLMQSFEQRNESGSQGKDVRTAFTYEDGTCTIVSALGTVFKDNFESLLVQLQNMGGKDREDLTIVERLKTLNNIYKHVKMIREASDDTVEENLVRSEWHFAAIVVDRLGLLLFGVILATTTIAIIAKAPYLVA